MSTGSEFRLLFIYIGVRSHNPTVPTLIEGFNQTRSPNVRCIDLLVTPLSTLATHLKWASMALIEHTVLMSRGLPGGIKHFIQFNHQMTETHTTYAISMMLDSGTKLALLAGNYDLHSPLGGDLASDEISRFSILVWPYVDEPISLDQVSASYQESWMRSRIDPFKNWSTIKHLIPTQVEYTHVLSPKEILSTPRIRRYQASVPGVSYATRRAARESAQSLRLSVAPISQRDKVLRTFTKGIAFGPLSNIAQSIRFTLRQANMRSLVRASATAYVCGGGYEYLVRKFLEVPAFGTPMVAYPVPMLERLGFVPHLNFIPAMPEEYGETALKILGEPEKAAEIAQRAAHLVFTTHTTEVRVQALISVLHSIHRETASGARFRNGRLFPDLSI